MKSLENLNDLFVHELRDLYDAEKQLATALPLLLKPRGPKNCVRLRETPRRNEGARATGDALKLLKQTVAEEERQDKQLTQLSEQLNPRAATADQAAT